MKDPTYEKDKIESNGVWHIAFIMSEMLNDNAPIGWSKYIQAAEKAMKNAMEVKQGGRAL